MPIDASAVVWDEPAAPSATEAPATPPAPAPAPAAAAGIDAAAVQWDSPAAAPGPESNPTPAAAGAGAPPASSAAPAVAAQPVAQPRTPLEQLGHQAGLTARAAVQGAAALPGMVSDVATGLINAGLDAYTDARAPTAAELVTGKQKGFRFQKVSSALGNVMDQAGVAQPETPTERVVQDAATGVAAAASGVGLGQALSTASGPITKALGSALAAAPGAQVVSGATGGGAAGIARESGAGPVGQGIAGVAGALAPTVAPFAAGAAARGVLRGGEAGRQQVADNIATFEQAAGTTPTLGQATQSRTLQSMETGLSNVVGSSGIMIRRGEQQANALAKSVDDLTSRLAPTASGADAGEAIARGVATFRDNVRTTQQRLYNALDRFIAPEAPITVSNTRAALQDLNAGIEGAENLSKWFRNAKLSDLERSLVADLEAAAARQAPAGSRSSLMNAAPLNLDAATLPYESIKKMRTLVGREMSDANFTSEINRDKWSRLYAALSEDLGATAKAAGPQAEQAWTRANTFTRLASERMEQIASIVNRDAPEKIFKAATSGLADGGTQINRLMKSMPVENRREVAAAVLQRLGRAKPGQQNELGDAFSSETFLTNLANLSPAARRALFSTSGFPGLEQKVTLMGRMAANRREGSKVFANPSGTARQGALIGWAAGLASALGSGNSGAVTLALAAPTITNLGARVVTSERLVKALAKPAQLSEAAAPAALTAGAVADDTDRPGLRRMREARAARTSAAATR